MSVIKSIWGALVPNIKAVASHEVAHGLLAAHVGLKVHKIELLHGGRGGCATISGQSTNESELLVIVAGFVGEELARGHAAVTGFTQLQYAQDYQAAQKLVGSDIKAIKKAIDTVRDYLTQPEIQAYNDYLVNVLATKGVIKGDMVKGV